MLDFIVARMYIIQIDTQSSFKNLPQAHYRPYTITAIAIAVNSSHEYEYQIRMKNYTLV
ncbi:hypothetical protein GJV44_00523 [Candidatus Vallotia cooleyia]|nr:hypothetical protein GJV44_00523 [Candidatus Vallotia cooleyia]